ncbi:hypothetical protein ABPG75_005263 [Micractinium tetrahymenae]
MFLRWAAPAKAWLSPARLVPPGEDQRVVELQGRVLDFLSRLASAAASDATTPAAALAAAGLPHLLVGPSTIPGAGRGLFLAPGSSVPAGEVLTLYPGLVYDQELLFREMAAASPGDEDAFAPAPPAFTIDNHYLLHLRACLGRCLMVDGRPGGLSAVRFAAAARDGGAAVNAAWLATEGREAAGACPAASMKGSTGTAASGSGSSGGSGSSSSASSTSSGQHGPDALLLQAAAGHMINHQPASKANATFDLCPLPASLPPALLRFVPALNAGGADPGLRWVPLVRALHPLAAPEPGSGVSSGTSSSGSTSSSGGGGSGSSSSSGSGSDSAGSSSPAGLELFVDYGADATTLGFHF